MPFPTLMESAACATLGVFRQYGGEDVDLCWRLGEQKFRIIKTAKVYVHHFEHSSVEKNEFDYRKALAKNNRLLYKLWGKKVFAKEEEILKKMSPEEAKRRYPFLSVFKSIKLRNEVGAF